MDEVKNNYKLLSEVYQSLNVDKVISEEDFVNLSDDDRKFIMNNVEAIIDAEELTELSKATMGSYVKKANMSSASAYHKIMSAPNPEKGDKDKTHNKFTNRFVGINRATDKLVKKEEVEDKDKKDSKLNKAMLASKFMKKIKMAKEGSEEDMDESKRLDKNDDERPSIRDGKKASNADRYLKRIGSMNKEKMKRMHSEETESASSLHPAAKSVVDPKSKLSVIHAAIGAMASMKNDDLLKLYTDTFKNFGYYGDGAPDAAEKNKASVAMKPSAAVKEELDGILGDETLSEEFKEKAAVLFENAVNVSITMKEVELVEEFNEALEHNVSVIVEEITEELNTFLDFAVEHWMKSNEVAIESALRNELTEEFITGLKTLFNEHYIEVPESKVDVLESLSDRVDDLEAKLAESIKDKETMFEELTSTKIEAIVTEMCSDLVKTQQEKFVSLAEGVDFDGNFEKYAKKLKIVKENYFKKKTSDKTSNLTEEVFESNDDLKEEVFDHSVANMAKAIRSFS